MKKTVIHLFGASGSGTSALGRFISEKQGCFFMDTDSYYWKPTDPPYTSKQAPSDRIGLMLADIRGHERIVISGSLTGWGDVLIPFFTLAVRLETATDIRIERLKKREREHFGTRIDPGGDMYENHLKFLEWASSYDSGGPEMRSRTRHDEWQKLLRCPVILLDGSRSLETNYKILQEYL